MIGNQNREDTFTSTTTNNTTNSLFPPSPPHSSNQSEITLKMMEEEDQQQQQQQQEYTPSYMDFEEDSNNDEVLIKDLAEFISQSRADSPRTPPISPRMMFFLGEQQQEPLMDFDLYDVIDSPDSDYQLFPTLPE
ncbi:hypothetical protein K501DRAFT_284455 [Backusella circina FSU 941]|nr:hypothetical protein K501DRAFT_289461 [Backusella circina FSU 941]KAI8885122.1 hypothetical protein K501DRAFT_284455 [Backusella circina FSU 941]